MRDLVADWRRWTRVERIVAVFIALGMCSVGRELPFAEKEQGRRHAFHLQSITAHRRGGC